MATRKQEDLKDLYTQLITNTGKEIMPTFEKRERKAGLIAASESVDVKIELMLRSYLDVEEKEPITAQDAKLSEFEAAEKRLAITQMLIANLDDTLSQIARLLVAGQARAQKVFERVLSGGLDDALKSEGERINGELRRLQWLEKLFESYRAILVQDETDAEKEIQAAFRKRLGARIRQARKERGITAEEFNSRISIGTMTLFRYEKGLTSPDAEILYRIAKLLNVSANWLIGREN